MILPPTVVLPAVKTSLAVLPGTKIFFLGVNLYCDLGQLIVYMLRATLAFLENNAITRTMHTS